MMLTMAAVMTVSAAACAQNRGEKRMQTDNKTLVVYLSRIVAMSFCEPGLSDFLSS